MKSALVCRIREVRWMEGTLFTILVKIILLSYYSRSVKSRGNSQRIRPRARDVGNILLC